MVILTAKLSKPKIIGIVCAAAAVIIFLILISGRNAAGAIEETGGRRSVKLSTPESRVTFLAETGYTVDPTPVRTQEVRIPGEFSEVYETYNRLQLAQGFDLRKYRDKTVLQVVYQVTDYPSEGEEPVLATLLLYRNKLVGADLSRGGADSFLRPLLEA